MSGRVEDENMPKVQYGRRERTRQTTYGRMRGTGVRVRGREQGDRWKGKGGKVRDVGGWILCSSVLTLLSSLL